MYICTIIKNKTLCGITDYKIYIAFRMQKQS